MHESPLKRAKLEPGSFGQAHTAPELLHEQLRVVRSLLDVYTVEHHAVLEELNALHAAHVRAGRPVLKDGSPSGQAPTKDSATNEACPSYSHSSQPLPSASPCNTDPTPHTQQPPRITHLLPQLAPPSHTPPSTQHHAPIPSPPIHPSKDHQPLQPQQQPQQHDTPLPSSSGHPAPTEAPHSGMEPTVHSSSHANGAAAQHAGPQGMQIDVHHEPPTASTQPTATDGASAGQAAHGEEGVKAEGAKEGHESQQEQQQQQQQQQREGELSQQTGEQQQRECEQPQQVGEQQQQREGEQPQQAGEKQQQQQQKEGEQAQQASEQQQADAKQPEGAPATAAPQEGLKQEVKTPHMPSPPQLHQEGIPSADTHTNITAAPADAHTAASTAHAYGDSVLGYGMASPQRAVFSFAEAEQLVLSRGVGSTGQAAGTAGAPPPPTAAAAPPPPTAAASAAAGAGAEREGAQRAACVAVASDAEVTGWRERFVQQLPAIARLEAAASAISEQDLDAAGALACLASRTGRYLIMRTTVLLGRSTDVKGEVDVDLSNEDLEGKVCRRQAYLTLDASGQFTLMNAGQRPLAVDGREVQQFGSMRVGHLSLIEAGDVQLLLMVNTAAVQRVLRRTSERQQEPPEMLVKPDCQG